MPNFPRLTRRSESSSTPLLPISRPDTSFPDNAKFDNIEEDDPVWKQYVDAARVFDTNMIDEWNKFLDVILVFVSASLLWFILKNDVL
jgi:hypothetical protein